MSVQRSLAAGFTSDLSAINNALSPEESMLGLEDIFPSSQSLIPNPLCLIDQLLQALLGRAGIGLALGGPHHLPHKEAE